MKPWTPPRGRVLVVAPHPDDEALGCGGVLRLHALRGDPVAAVFLTGGEAGGADAATRRREARRSCRLLGVRRAEFWDFPDGGLARARGLAERLRGLLERERPDLVYRPAEDDPHPDHRAAARGFARAKRGWKRPLADWRYEVGFLPRPDAVADVGAVFPRKLRALRAHRSQLPDALRLGERAGLLRSLLLHGVSAAEAFRRGRP